MIKKHNNRIEKEESISAQRQRVSCSESLCLVVFLYQNLHPLS